MDPPGAEEVDHGQLNCGAARLTELGIGEPGRFLVLVELLHHAEVGSQVDQARVETLDRLLEDGIAFDELATHGVPLCSLTRKDEADLGRSGRPHGVLRPHGKSLTQHLAVVGSNRDLVRQIGPPLTQGVGDVAEEIPLEGDGATLQIDVEVLHLNSKGLFAVCRDDEQTARLDIVEPPVRLVNRALGRRLQDGVCISATEAKAVDADVLLALRQGMSLLGILMPHSSKGISVLPLWKSKLGRT